MQKLFFIICCSFLCWGCDSLPVKQDLNTVSYPVVDQDSVSLTFPQDFMGKVTLLSYIYTHCPDVCPMITANMKNVARKLGPANNLQFVGISFDPERDTPQVLKRYARSYHLDTGRWHLLTGEEAIIDSLLADLNIKAQQSYTRFNDAGEPIYYINHTDRITLVDVTGQIRKHYAGSRANTEEIVLDIGRLLNQTNQHIN